MGNYFTVRGADSGVQVMAQDKADSFLAMIRFSRRGRLKIYLGYSAGVGKTYQMLLEGQRLKQEGFDVVLGLIETHGRVEIGDLAKGLEVIPKRQEVYHGVALEEMDVTAILSRKPQVVLIDELAHTNLPGSLNPKRYQDVQDIVTAGIHVITTMNVQHLESLYDIVERSVGLKVRERLPDSVLVEADQIVDVDISTEDLLKRLREGKIYSKERVEAVTASFFKSSNLEKLREITLRELASHIDSRRRESSDEAGTRSDQVMVCLSSRGPNTEKLLRFGSRLAGKLNRDWYAVYVQTPREETSSLEPATKSLISDTLALAKELGAMVFTYKGERVAETLLTFAEEYRVGHIVIGRGMEKPFWKRFGRNRHIVQDVVKKATGVTVTVVDTRREQPMVSRRANEISEEESSTLITPSAASEPRYLTLSRLLSPKRIVIWDQPVRKETVLRTLTEVAEHTGAGDAEKLLKELLDREEKGSTFFNEGVAFPHLRSESLSTPVVVLGLTRQGILNVLTVKSIELVFLILSPAQIPESQNQVLGLASRAGQNRQLLKGLCGVRTPREVMEVIRQWEMPRDTDSIPA